MLYGIWLTMNMIIFCQQHQQKYRACGISNLWRGFPAQKVCGQAILSFQNSVWAQNVLSGAVCVQEKEGNDSEWKF